MEGVQCCLATTAARLIDFIPQGNPPSKPVDNALERLWPHIEFGQIKSGSVGEERVLTCAGNGLRLSGRSSNVKIEPVCHFGERVSWCAHHAPSREAPSVLLVAQAAKDSEEFKAQALKQWEDPSMPVVPPGNARC